MGTTGTRWSESIRTGPSPNAAFDANLERALSAYEPPSFPEVILRALSTLRDPNAALAEVGSQLAFDPRISIKLLSLVNSPAYAFRSPVLSVEHAVGMLGRAQVEPLLLAMGVRGALPRRGGQQLDYARFWRAAARRAVLAKRLAQATDTPDPAAIFTAALLQDMAVPVLSAQAGQVYDGMMGEWLAAGDDLARLEDAEFGYNHADVGGWLCERWRFPDGLTGAIGNHHRGHRTYSSRPPPPVELVACLREGDVAFGEDEFVETTSHRTGLTTERVVELLEHAKNEATAVAEAYQ